MKKRIKTKKFIICFITFIVLYFNFFLIAFAADFEHDYILDKQLRKIPIPISYVTEKVIDNFGKDINLNNPQDIFIDSKNNLYIVDTGNNRIVKLSGNGDLLGVFTGPDNSPLSEPNGIYVDEDEDMYIADTGNERIIHLSNNGKYVEQFTKPKSELYDNKYPFRPIKVFIDKIGYIYILNKDDYHGFIVLDATNKFQGYIAPTKLEFSLRDLFIRLFATKEQKDMLEKRLPPAHSNFLIHSDGMIYATTIRTDNAQVKKITPIGNNIYKKTDFFGERVNSLGKKNEPMFVDLCVDKNGIITALDNSSCKLYQYDPEGNLLTVFGGYGAWKGKFINPSSVAIDSSENLYVLDASLNNIQVLKPTKFISTIHHGIKLYYQGKYKEAVTPWMEILKIDPNYIIANKGLAKALMKQGKWIEAMKHYKNADDKEGYSQAFAEYRHENFRKYFIFYVFAFILILFILLKIISIGFRKSQMLADNYYFYKK
ncbi:hypothetical protein ACAG39_09370 [Caldicellulosiruptoraceae bacterium PP1]